MRRIVPYILSSALLLTACGGENGTGTSTLPPPGIPPQQTIQFTALPMALSDLINVFPLGNVNPPGHTFPSDHVGLTHTLVSPITAGKAVVYAPAGGYVRAIYRSGDDGIEIGPQPPNERGAERTWYSLGHITLDAAIQVGTRLTAGQRIGVSSGLAFGVDFGLVDATVINPFVRPERYGSKQLNGVKPLSRFTAALRSQLAARVDRVGASDEEGTFVYDIAGRLMGNWFHESLPFDQSAETSPANWSKHLAFVEVPTTKGERVITTGGFSTGESGVYWIEPSGPDFATISPSSGKVVFASVASFTRWWEQIAQPNRYFLVEMTGAETLRLEMFDGSAVPTAFTAAAATYKR